VEVGTCDGEDDARETRTRSDVTHRGAVRDGLGQDRTVEKVPIPETVHFTRTEQASLDPGADEKLRVPQQEG